MSYNGSGLFQINTSGQPVVAGTVITASAFNALTADLATGLTTAITKDGQTATTAQIPFAQGLRSTLTTDSTNSTSGSIITDGGLGVAKAVNIGSTLNVAGTTDSTTSTTGTIITAGGLGVAKAVNIGTTLGVTGAVTGSSTITGTKLIPTGTSATGNGMYLPAANVLGFSTNGTLAAVIDANQNVGVGVTPSAWGTAGNIDFTGNYAAGNNGFSQNAYNGSGGWKYSTTAAASVYQQAAGAHKWFNAASGTAGNAITFTQAMTLDASGNLLVGTTSATGTLTVKGTSTARAGTVISLTDSSAGNLFKIANDGLITTGGAANPYGNTTATGANAVFAADGVFYRSTSALKYKQDIRDIESIDIAKFRPIRYKSKCNGDDQTLDHFGIVADEVDQAGIKELVSYGLDGQVEGFQYERLTVVLLKAIQELNAKFEEYKAAHP